MSSRQYRVDQEIEIYNFGVALGLQMSKEVNFQWLMCVFLSNFIKLNCFATNEVPFGFQEELMVRLEPQKRDLQF